MDQYPRMDYSQWVIAPVPIPIAKRRRGAGRLGNISQSCEEQIETSNLENPRDKRPPDRLIDALIDYTVKDIRIYKAGRWDVLCCASSLSNYNNNT